MKRFFSRQKEAAEALRVEDLAAHPELLSDQRVRNRITDWRQVVEILRHHPITGPNLLIDRHIIDLLCAAKVEVIQECPLSAIVEKCSFYLDQELFLQAATELKLKLKLKLKEATDSPEYCMLLGWYNCCNHMFVAEHDVTGAEDDLYAALSWFQKVLSTNYLYRDAQLAQAEIYSMLGREVEALGCLCSDGCDKRQAREILTMMNIVKEFFGEGDAGAGARKKDGLGFSING